MTGEGGEGSLIIGEESVISVCGIHDDLETGSKSLSESNSDTPRFKFTLLGSIGLPASPVYETSTGESPLILGDDVVKTAGRRVISRVLGGGVSCKEVDSCGEPELRPLMKEGSAPDET
jgi:hypothetical protein